MPYRVKRNGRSQRNRKPRNNRTLQKPNGILGPRVQKAEPGAAVQLSAAGSTDPDGDKLIYEWFIYPEAGTYRGPLALNATSPETRFVVPPDAGGKTIHLIVAVRDRGELPLARYRRAVLRGVKR